MVSHHPVNFGGHSHCGSEDMFKWFKSKIPDGPLNLPLLLMSKAHAMKAHGMSY